MSSCQDDNYDFDDVDMTVGIGGDGLTLPVSSTSVIKLEDVLELTATMYSARKAATWLPPVRA